MEDREELPGRRNQTPGGGEQPGSAVRNWAQKTNPWHRREG